MAVWTVAALGLAIVVIVNCYTCPWMVATRKGLLLAHFVFANVADAVSEYFSMFTLLWVAVAAVGIIFEIATTAGNKEVRCVGSERLLFMAMILFIDVSVFLCSSAAPLEVSAAIFSVGVYFGVYLCCKSLTSPSDMTMKERYDLHSSDLFYNGQRPIECLGQLGTTHFLVIFGSLLATIVHLLASSDFFLTFLSNLGSDAPKYFRHYVNVALPMTRYVLYNLRSMCLLSMFGMPAILAGFIHSMKTFGRWHALRKAAKVKKKTPQFDSLLANVST